MRLRNFMSCIAVDLELANKGLVAIEGENKDNTSAKSNGSGKSTLVDGLSWIGYGVTAKGVTGDAIVNNKVKKDCEGELVVEDDGIEYVIRRYRKHHKHKNQLMVFRRDSLTGSEVNLSKGTDKETQIVVNGILGASYEVFCAAVYLGQEKMPDIPNMTDKQLKALIEEASGLELLASAFELAKEHHGNVGKTIFKIQGEISHLQQRIEDKKAVIVEQKQQLKDNEKSRREATKSILMAIKPLQAEITTNDIKLETVEKDLSGFVLTPGLGLADYTNQRTRLMHEITDLNKQADRLDWQCKDGNKDCSNSLKEYKRVKAEIAAGFSHRVGEICKACGRPHTIADLPHIEEEASNELTRWAEAAKKGSAATKLMLAELAALLKQRDAKSDEVATLSSIISLMEQRYDITLDSKRKVEEIARIKTAAAAALRTDESIEATLATHERHLEDLTFEQESLKGSLEHLQDDLALAQSAVDVLGPAGVRAHVLDTVTPFLNERTSEYLGTLTDGMTTAVWSTLSKTAKGELREKFVIEVQDAAGAESFAALSGGEKRKVRLGCSMALQDLVASRAVKPINIFVGDEIDDALDEAGLERLMQILEKKAREKGTVLVISHNSLSDWIDSVMLVEKSGGATTVTGACVTSASASPRGASGSW